MAFRWPRLHPRDLAIGFYAVVWAAVVLIREWHGTPVSMEMFGAFVTGLTALRLLWRNRSRDQSGDDNREEP